MTHFSRSGRLWFWLAAPLAALVVAGCGEGDDAAQVPIGRPDDGGIVRPVADVPNRPADTAADAPGMPRPTDAARDGGGNAFGVKITIEVEKPVKDSVVVAAMLLRPDLTVTVEAPMGAPAETVTDVTAVVIHALTKQKAATAKINRSALNTVPGSNTLIYKFGETPVDIATLESAAYNLEITVLTINGVEGKVTVPFRIDAGPTIRIESPGNGKFYRNGVPLNIEIADALFGPVSDVSIKVGQNVIPFSPPADAMSNRYTGNLNFLAFNPPLDGELLLTVRAKNQNGTESVVLRKFVSDNKGPAITNTKPKNGDLVGKVLMIEAEIADGAGVVESSAVAVVAHGGSEFVVKLNPPPAGSMTGGKFTALFDTTKLPANAIFPSISFRAEDTLGNGSTLGFTLSLDYNPPLSDLDPPHNVRGQINDMGALRCTWPFDPVGEDAVDDGDLVPQVFDIRARIEDQGNAPLTGLLDFTPIAGVEETRAQLLILDDTSLPLVVDADGEDGICDSLNPVLTPTTLAKANTDALLINLVPLNPGGAADVTPELAATCLTGLGIRKPEASCATTVNPAKGHWNHEFQIGYRPVIHSDYMSLVIGHGTGNKLPSVWTIGPVVEDRVQCAGRQFDALANNLSDGWACMAILATDKLGNTQVSRPLRLCIDRDGKPDPKTNLPDCPHKRIKSASWTTPTIIETQEKHGFVDGDEILVNNVNKQTLANGRWRVKRVDDLRVELVGSKALAPGLCFDDGVVSASSTRDCTNKIVSLSSTTPVVVEMDQPFAFKFKFLDPVVLRDFTIVNKSNAIVTGAIEQVTANGRWTKIYPLKDDGTPYDFPANPDETITSKKFQLITEYQGQLSLGIPYEYGGFAVKTSELPDCTGTVTSKGPPPVVKTGTEAGKSYACKQWRAFPLNENKVLGP